MRTIFFVKKLSVSLVLLEQVSLLGPHFRTVYKNTKRHTQYNTKLKGVKAPPPSSLIITFQRNKVFAMKTARADLGILETGLSGQILRISRRLKKRSTRIKIMICITTNTATFKRKELLSSDIKPQNGTRPHTGLHLFWFFIVLY